MLFCAFKDSGMENPTYGSNSNELGANEPMYETVPDNDNDGGAVTQGVQNHNETDYTVIS